MQPEVRKTQKETGEVKLGIKLKSENGKKSEKLKLETGQMQWAAAVVIAEVCRLSQTYCSRLDQMIKPKMMKSRMSRMLR